MRIRPDQNIAGVPILKVRGLLRSWWTLEAVDVQSALDMTEQGSMVLLRELEQRGYVSRRDDGRYEQTDAGNVFAAAKATPSLRRKSAERILSRFLTRVEEVRTNPTYLWRAERIILFGSMTSGMEKVNGIDLAIQYQRKEPDDGVYQELAHKCAEDAQEAGRQLLGLDYYAWPLEKVRLHLKMNSWGLNLSRFLDEPPNLPGARLIYTHREDSPGQRLLW